MAEPSELRCPQCAAELPAHSRFCLQCGRAVAADARPEAGWGVIVRDLVCPGWGHYHAGWRKSALVFGGVTVLGFSLGALEEARATMSVLSRSMESGIIPDAAELTRRAVAASGLAGLWYGLAGVSWLATLAHAIRLRLVAHDGNRP